MKIEKSPKLSKLHVLLLPPRILLTLLHSLLSVAVSKNKLMSSLRGGGDAQLAFWGIVRGHCVRDEMFEENYVGINVRGFVLRNFYGMF